jgi:PGF-pre-PGF domain-containing protein
MIDAVPPSISFVSPTTPAGTYRQNWIAANVTASDSGSELGTITIDLYYYNSPNNRVGRNVSVSSPAFYNFTNLPDGTYYLLASAADRAGNLNSTMNEIVLDATGPTVSLSLSADRIYIGNSITVNCSASSASGIQSISVSSDDGTSICSGSSTDSCSGTYKPTTIGTKTITCSVTNNVGSSKTETTTLTVYSVSGRSSSFVSSISSIQASASTNRVSAGQSVSYNFSVAPNLPLITISVTFANALSGISLTASKIAAPPADAPAVPGIPSAYVKVEKNGFKDSDLSSTTLDFKVDKSWIDENGIDPAKVSVYKLENNTWTQLTTTKSNEDDKYIYYSAVSPSGLSIFAISGEKKTVAPPSEEKPQTNVTEEGAKPKPVDYTWIIIAIIVLIIAGGVYYYFTSKKSTKK